MWSGHVLGPRAREELECLAHLTLFIVSENIDDLRPLKGIREGRQDEGAGLHPEHRMVVVVVEFSCDGAGLSTVHVLLRFCSRMKGETPVNSTMSIGQARKMVEQLKIEASLCRIKVGGDLTAQTWA